MSDAHEPRAGALLSDAELSHYLDGDTSLSEAYRSGAHEQPPAHLDAAILSAALAGPGAETAGEAAGRNALLAGAGRVLRRLRPLSARAGASSPFGGRWGLPVVAATAVVVASVVLLSESQVGLDEETLVPSALSEDAAPSAASTARVEPTDTAESKLESMPTRGAIEPLPEVTPPRVSAPRLPAATLADDAEGAPSAAARASAAQGSATGLNQAEPRQARAADPSSPADSPQSPPAPTALATAPSTAAPEPATEAYQPPGDRAALARQLLEKTATQRRELDRRRRAIAQERARLAAIVADANRGTPPRPAAAARQVEQVPAATAPAPARGLQQTRPAAGGGAMSPALALALDRIRVLIAEGRREEALSALQRFERLAPSVPVPDDIRAALGRP